MFNILPYSPYQLIAIGITISVIVIYYIIRLADVFKPIEFIHILSFPNQYSLCNLFNWLERPEGSRLLSDRLERFGLVQCRIFNSRVVIIGDKELAAYVLQGIPGNAWLNRKYVTLINPKKAIEASEWKKVKEIRLVSQSLEERKRHAASLESNVNNLTVLLRHNAKTKTPVDIEKLISKFNIEAICQLAFNYEFDDNFNEIHESLSCLVEFAKFAQMNGSNWMMYLPVESMRRFRRADDCLMNFIRSMHKNLVASEQKKLIKSTSLARSLIGWFDTPNLKINAIHADLYLFVLLSHHIITHSLKWFIYVLCQHPQIKNQVHSVYGGKFSLNDNNSSLPKNIESILKESMRKYPAKSIGNPRTVDQENGFILPLFKDVQNISTTTSINIPEGTYVYTSIFNIRNSSKTFGFDVLDFRASRWEECSISSSLEDMLLYPLPHLSNKALFEMGGNQSLSTQIALIAFELMIPMLSINFDFSFIDDIATEQACLEALMNNKSILLAVVDRSISS